MGISFYTVWTKPPPPPPHPQITGAATCCLKYQISSRGLVTKAIQQVALQQLPNNPGRAGIAGLGSGWGGGAQQAGPKQVAVNHHVGAWHGRKQKGKRYRLGGGQYFFPPSLISLKRCRMFAFSARNAFLKP